MRIGTFAYLVTGPPHTYFYATYTRTGTAAEGRQRTVLRTSAYLPKAAREFDPERLVRW
jgi:hypothetical protein